MAGYYSPVPGASVSTPYGRSGPMWSSGRHTGADFSAPSGSAIRAAVPGTVISTGNGGAYGNLVKVRHDDGSVGYYAHMSSVATRPGVRVQRGSFLGRVGSTGNSTGPHLHFEIRRGGRSVNPLGWLQGDYEVNTDQARDMSFGEPLTYEDPYSRPMRTAPSTLGGGFYHGEEFDIEAQLAEELPGNTAEASEMEMV